MTRPFSKLLCCAAVAALACSAPALGQDHKMHKAKDLSWQDVPSLPKGAKVAVIEGPMNESVPFTVRLKFPANYRIPPHFHPGVERVTVVSGTFSMGMGETFDEKKVMDLRPGDMMIMQPKTPHFAKTKGETVVQVHGTGPWGVTYVNPGDDPRTGKK